MNKVILSNESYGILNEWIGKIDRKSNSIDPRTRMQSVYAKVVEPYKKVKNKLPLKIGMYVNAEIIGVKINNSIKIPRDLINDNTVWIVNEENELEKRNVEILFFDKDYVVLKKGLNNGDQLLLTQLSIMIENMKVRLK